MVLVMVPPWLSVAVAVAVTPLASGTVALPHSVTPWPLCVGALVTNTPLRVSEMCALSTGIDAPVAAFGLATAQIGSAAPMASDFLCGVNSIPGGRAPVITSPVIDHGVVEPSAATTVAPSVTVALAAAGGVAALHPSVS